MSKFQYNVLIIMCCSIVIMSKTSVFYCNICDCVCDSVVVSGTELDFPRVCSHQSDKSGARYFFYLSWFCMLTFYKVYVQLETNST